MPNNPNTKIGPRQSRLDELAKPKRYPNIGSPRVSASKKLINGGPIRKSFGHGVQKKKPQKFGSHNGQQNQSTVHAIVKAIPDSRLLTTVPRAILLTPSSSDNSIAASNTASGALTYTIFPKKLRLEQPEQVKPMQLEASKTALLPYLYLQRQNTVGRLAFAARKSASQMDFKEARRTGNYQVATTQSLIRDPSELANKTLVAVQPPLATMPMDEENEGIVMKEARLMKSLFQGDMCYIMRQQQPDVRMASLRIFNAIMLHAWRQRRAEVHRLNNLVEEIKRSLVKNKNQLHVYNSLFKVEQRRNDYLNEQLQRSYNDSVRSKTNLDELTESLRILKIENTELQTQITAKMIQLEDMQAMLERNKTELFQALCKQRELLGEMTQEQRKRQQAELEKEELTKECDELKTKYFQNDLDLQAALLDKGEIIKKNLATLKEYDRKFVELEAKAAELDATHAYEDQLKKKLQSLQNEVATLQQCLAATLGSRLRNCINQSIAYHKATYQMLHWVAYYMLPAAPPPRVTALPVGLAVKKVKAFFNANFRN